MSSLFLAISAKESRRLSQFLQDQEQTRRRVATLEEQAQVFADAGKGGPRCSSHEDRPAA